MRAPDLWRRQRSPANYHRSRTALEGILKVQLSLPIALLRTMVRLSNRKQVVRLQAVVKVQKECLGSVFAISTAAGVAHLDDFATCHWRRV